MKFLNTWIMRSRLLIMILIVILSLTTGTGFAQRITKSNYEIIFRTSEGTIRALVTDKKKKVREKPDRQYTGYYMNQLFCKQGELQGKPLNGKYCRYDLKDNILESGNFNYGLKEGVWKQLSPEGMLTETCQYREGILFGERIIYKTGKPDILENYYKGKLIGKPKYLNPEIDPKNRKGENVKKKNLFHRLFRRKDHKPGDTPDKKAEQKIKVDSNPNK